MTRQTALVTGASSGIGLDLVRLLARDGYDVVLVARSEAKLREIAADLESRHGIKAHVVSKDLAVPHAASDLVSELTRRGIDIDILINNAGYGGLGAFIETDLQFELDMIQLNVVALTELTKLLVRPMVARKRGRIMNVASTAAFQPGPRMAVYYATKAYVLSFSEAVADELRDSGVTVTTLAPGPTETGFADVAKMRQSRLFKMMPPMSSSKVAEAGYRAMMAGRGLVVPGVRNKLLAQSVRFSPRRLVTMITRTVNADSR